jgi:hypothetical protein
MTELVKRKEITYKTGFAHRGISGVFFNKEDSTEYVYFAAFLQPKKLSFFPVLDEETPKIEIPLDSIMDWRTVKGIAIKNLDTIILVNSSSMYSARSKITFIDRKGHCWENLHLDEMILADENKFKYSYFLPCDIPLNFLDNDIVFFNANKSYREGDSVPKDNKDYLKYIIPLSRQSSILMKFNTNTHQYQQILSNIWNIECPDTNLYIVGFQFSLENNILFIYSQTGNKLYLLDKETFEINKEIEIKSPYTGIGKAACSLEDRYESYYNDNYGRLRWITYDEYNELYYVAFTHEVKDVKDYSMNFEHTASFSIQIYNKVFKQLAEQVFDGKKYNPKHCIVTSKGMLIGHSSATKDYSPYEIKYDLYEIKK